MRILITVSIIFVLIGCKRSTVIADDLVGVSQRTGAGGKKISEGDSGRHEFYRLDSLTEYGPAYTYYLNQEDFDKPICLVISGKARTNYVNSNGAITFALYDSITQLNWDASKLKCHIVDLNKWSRFEEKIFFRPSTKGFRYNKINVQSFLPNAGKEVFDIDSLKIKLIALPNI